MLKVKIIFCVLSVYLVFNSECSVKGKKFESLYSKYNNNGKVNWNEFRYDKESMVLTKIETTTKCKENMRFFADPNNETLGECDCDYFECSRPLMYSPKTKQCHFAWSQGPCDSEEWFVFSATMKPICEMNPCPKVKPNDPKAPFYFRNQLDGKCYQVGSKGYCQDEDEFLATSLDDPIPSCRKYVLCGGFSYPATQLCMPGHKITFAGSC